MGDLVLALLLVAWLLAGIVGMFFVGVLIFGKDKKE